MPNEATISKWGNSLAVRIPQGIARQAGLSEGDSIELNLDAEGSIVVRSTRRKYELAELVSGITPRNRHRETEWGEALGEESW